MLTSTPALMSDFGVFGCTTTNNAMYDDSTRRYKQNATPVNSQPRASASAGGGGGGGGSKGEDDANDNENEDQGQQGDPPTLELLSDAELSHFNKEEVKYKITMLEEERSALREKVDLSAIAEYYAKDAEYVTFCEVTTVPSLVRMCVSVLLLWWWWLWLCAPFVLPFLDEPHFPNVSNRCSRLLPQGATDPHPVR